jgi:eukaryotic-like serine/threonine-protein kinase
MPLTAGSRLGTYEVLEPLGSGGMGEVFRARDSRLGRDVAIKALPEAFALDPDRLARFEREARLLASLSDPNIAGIHGLEEVDGRRYLVLECVEGPTLAERLATGPLPLEEALEVCRQIAAGVEAAHESGVVHRDLKPGNVKLTPRGEVKVLDFGLAKGGGATGDGSGPNLSASPTLPYGATLAGVILGTAAYMSPEQARGRLVDRRTDIWSFGCVLFECLTGRPLFEGETVSDLIARILQTEPDWSALPPATPPRVRALLARCLRRDPRERLRDIGDARIELAEVIAGRGADPGAAPAAAGVPVPAPRWRRTLPWALAALAFVAAIASALVAGGPRAKPVPIHASLLPPAGSEFSSSWTNPQPLAVAPDGSLLVFCARSGEGADRLWVRGTGSPDARPLAGTEDASSPFFSPDGHSIGFFANGKLKRVDVAGGPVITLADANDPRGGTWGRDGVILFTADSEGPVSRISAEGGAVSAVTALDTTLRETTHRYPSFLPDGRHFLYLARRVGAGAGEGPAIYAASLDRSRRTRVLGVASNVICASGHLLYVRGGILVAQPFDPGRLATTGPAVPLVDDLRWDERFSRGVFAASRNGLLAFMTGRAQTRTQLRWLDRNGHGLDRIGEAVDYTYGGSPLISPDGGRAAMAVLNPDRGTSDVFVVELATGRRIRVTVDESDHPGCAWMPDGRQVVVNDAHGACSLVMRAVGGTGADTVLTRPGWLWPTSATPDGRFVLFSDNRGQGGSDLLAAPVTGTEPPVPVAVGPAYEQSGQFSAEGRLVAYSSNESGRPEVYVVTFPGAGGKWQVSQDGGSEPRWGRDGRELFYVDRENRIISVEVLRSPSGFQAGAIRPLFQFHGAGGNWRYDVSADGSRFLVTVPPQDEAAPPVTLMTDWTARLGKR